MYDNIGKKIKGLAKALFIIEAIAAVIAGIVFWSIDEEFFFIGLLVIVGGALLAWISSWFLYGFGELIDKTCDIARNTCSGERKSEAQSKVEYERISKLERLRTQGLITEEEYQRAIAKKE